jgi:hypothetical protein
MSLRRDAVISRLGFGRRRPRGGAGGGPGERNESYRDPDPLPPQLHSSWRRLLPVAILILSKRDTSMLSTTVPVERQSLSLR